VNLLKAANQQKEIKKEKKQAQKKCAPVDAGVHRSSIKQFIDLETKLMNNSNDPA